MQSMTEPRLLEALREKLYPLPGTAQDYDRLMDLVGDARFVAARRGIPRHPRVLPRAITKV
jgi:hypothetical protein